ncbi:MAG: TatD family deoxyribonuclease [Planctomycetota bacterium]|nr:MAG: TatD family deoxyribonuclease [Planctomycetota bacterium]REK46042.1 MAG: TatD family deoxyribonuclease [Planctomycetota bacterium]
MLIDTHAHLDQPEFDDDRQAVVERALAAGVEQILAVAIDADSAEASVALAAQHATIHAAVGIQPNYCGQAAPGDWDRVLALVDRPKVVAIGETGLDRHWDYTPFDVQQDYFARHLTLARQRDLPFIVHTRESEADVLAMLREARERGPLCGVMHSFVGDAEVAAECVELGLFISFAGMVTFKKSQTLRDVAATIPDDRILVETDCPYLAPHPLRGKRNEPANVVHTAQVLAEVRGVEFEEFAATTTANARRLFGF